MREYIDCFICMKYQICFIQIPVTICTQTGLKLRQWYCTDKRGYLRNKYTITLIRTEEHTPHWYEVSINEIKQNIQSKHEYTKSKKTVLKFLFFIPNHSEAFNMEQQKKNQSKNKLCYNWNCSYRNEMLVYRPGPKVFHQS